MCNWCPATYLIIQRALKITINRSSYPIDTNKHMGRLSHQWGIVSPRKAGKAGKKDQKSCVVDRLIIRQAYFGSNINSIFVSNTISNPHLEIQRAKYNATLSMQWLFTDTYIPKYVLSDYLLE